MSEKLFVLGHPVAHSKSPAMYNAVFAALGLDWSYGFMDCATEDEARAFLEARGFLSANVTMPYKPLAFSQAGTVTSSALLARGANVLVVRDGSLVADNTDGLGCVAYLKRCGVAFEGARVALCGTGPTARAIMHACALAGAADITLLGRDGSRTATALDAYRAQLADLVCAGKQVADALDARYAFARAADIPNACAFTAATYQTGADAIERADLVVDATSLGMASGDPAPFAIGLLHPGQTVFDVVYAHGETALLAGARAQGARAFDGEGMLVAQAVATVHDIASVLSLDVDVDTVDLFAVMARAAGFGALAGACS